MLSADSLLPWNIIYPKYYWPSNSCADIFMSNICINLDRLERAAFGRLSPTKLRRVHY